MSAHHRELNKKRGSEPLVHTPYSCLPEILRARGYRTVFLQGGTKAFATKGDFLLAHGFEEVHGKAELRKRFPKRVPSRWGMHDDALVDYTREQVQRLEALREKDGRPYFIMMLTLDTHAPGLPSPGCRAPPSVRRISHDRNSRLMLRSLHCADKELGRLGQFLLHPKRREQTVWALTGDHPSAPWPFVRDIFRKRREPYAGWSGRLPLILHDPTHHLPKEVDVLSGTTDIAPTLLHILGIQDGANSMLGHSIFGRRARLPQLVGRMGPRSVSLHRPGRSRNVSMGRLQAMCELNQPVLPNDAEALSPCELLSWIRWRDGLWSNKRLLPPPAPKVHATAKQ